ncbi:MAG: ABC transporter ATP-binding protein [Gammaproteobacteria bacterium]|nr:ABC transporter ATP-binding protein [Gammaproteobacteria bacterium]NNJ49389.1 ABC transporter ATP-binding protein [Gammaproteobacteria bacterium]
MKCEQVVKSYADKIVLDGIELEIKQGEFSSLVGMNGCGKSTLIKAILDLIGIDSGVISIDGRSHRTVNARDNIAYLPDRFSPPVHLRGQDFIQYMLRLHGSDSNKQQIEEILDGLELDKTVMQESVNKLSKGMTQKLGLASCLLSGKSLLILDEPMSGLDPRARFLFKQQLAQLKQQGATVFFSSHVLADVEEMADSMAVLHDSRIYFSGTPDDFKRQYQAENVEQAYMNCIEDKQAFS